MPTNGGLYTIVSSLATRDGPNFPVGRGRERIQDIAPSQNEPKRGRREGMRNERADTEDTHRVDVARPLVRRAVASRYWRLARCAGASDRSGDHARRQCHRRGRAPGRCRGAGRAAGLGSHALRPARRDPAQGRRAHGGEPGGAGLLDHARDRRHRAQGRLRGADGGEHPAPLCCRATVAASRSPGACRAA